MNPEELKLKVQALVDNELDEAEIPAVMNEIEGSYEMRREYVELLRLRRRLTASTVLEPPEEWFEAAARRPGRRIFGWTGNFLFIGSYVVLLGFALFTLFRGQDTSTWVKIGVAGVAVGFVVLLLRAIVDRIRESRTDRYKEVMK